MTMIVFHCCTSLIGVCSDAFHYYYIIMWCFLYTQNQYGVWLRFVMVSAVRLATQFCQEVELLKEESEDLQLVFHCCISVCLCRCIIK